MAYSDYGGYAYRNGRHIESRSDATIGPEDVFGSPGIWPGFVALATGGIDEYEKRKDWPSGHVVLGDGPIYAVLYKQSQVTICSNSGKIGQLIMPWEGLPKSGERGEVAFEVDNHRIEVIFLEEDNYYQYVRLIQPDGNVWQGWSGYGVGAGLEDSGYGYSTKEREKTMLRLWPESSVENREATRES